MLRRFKLGAKKKWRTLATILPCKTYQEFYEIMLRIEDSENMSSDNEEEEVRGSNQMRHDKGNGQLSQGPRQTRVLRRVGIVLALLVGASVPQVREDEVDPLEDPAFRGLESQLVQVCRRCNNRHFGECRRGSSGCYTCGQTEHLSKYCPQRLQPPQQPQQPRPLQQFSLPPPVPTQQYSRLSGYAPAGRGGAYHYQGILFLILQGSTSTLRIPISMVVIDSIREVICRISRVVWASF